jgi:beta-galactosidase/beta-glucuronidase
MSAPPAKPVLHPILYRLLRGNEVLDQVESYFGLRKIDLQGGMFLLNDQVLTLRFVLVQGYYPGGSYAAPDKSLMENDILAAKAMGFNGARIH